MPTIGFGSWIYFTSNTNAEARYRNREEYLNHFGQWIAGGSEELVRSSARIIRQRVGKGIVHELKLSAQQEIEGNYLLVVYCDDRRRDELRKDLERLGFADIQWQYQKECIEFYTSFVNSVVEIFNEKLKALKTSV